MQYSLGSFPLSSALSSKNPLILFFTLICLLVVKIYKSKYLETLRAFIPSSSGTLQFLDVILGKYLKLDVLAGYNANGIKSFSLLSKTW